MIQRIREVTLHLDERAQRELAYMLVLLHTTARDYFLTALHNDIKNLDVPTEDLIQAFNTIFDAEHGHAHQVVDVAPSTRIRELRERAQVQARSVPEAALVVSTKLHHGNPQASKYRNVSLFQTHSLLRWSASVGIKPAVRALYGDKVQVHLGNYTTELEAAKVAHAAREIIAKEVSDLNALRNAYS